MTKGHRTANIGVFRLSVHSILALWLTGILQIQVDLSPIDNNPTAVLVAVVMSLLAALLLYEW